MTNLTSGDALTPNDRRLDPRAGPPAAVRLGNSPRRSLFYSNLA